MKLTKMDISVEAKVRRGGGGSVRARAAQGVPAREAARLDAAPAAARWRTLVSAASLLGALLLSFYGARKVVIPIQELVDTTRAIASGDLSRRVQVQSSDEVGELVVDPAAGA